MYFEDLTSYSYRLPFKLENVQNVGWLDSKHPYKHGSSSDEFLLSLRRIICEQGITTNCHVNIVRGIHACNLCKSENIEIVCNRENVILGMSEIWIPNLYGYYAAPSMILHYVVDHGYRPPQCYIDAVIAFKATDPFNAQNIYDQLIARRLG